MFTIAGFKKAFDYIDLFKQGLICTVSLSSVSYTHLDVYKRQGIFRSCYTFFGFSNKAYPDNNRILAYNFYQRSFRYTDFDLYCSRTFYTESL